MAPEDTDLKKLFKPVPFFTIDFALTWIPLWYAVYAMRKGVLTFSEPFMVLAGISATLAAMIMIYRFGSRILVRDYWDRVFNLKRIGAPWWLIIIFGPLLINTASIFVSTLWGGGIAQFAVSQNIKLNPLLYPLVLFLFGPLPEELGWRGYGLDSLHTRFPLLQSSLMLGAVWAFWHLPLSFLPGSFQQGLLQYPPLFVSFYLSFIPVTVVIHWVYKHNRRSTLSAIAFHFFINFFGELLSLGTPARLISFSLWLLFAVIVLAKDWQGWTRGRLKELS